MERQPSIQSSPAKVTMKERPETERPYEKCLRAGAESLTDGELLAVIIRCGTRSCTALELAFSLLNRHPVYKGLAGLHHLDIEMLKEIPGIGNVKAIEILCVLELSKRLARASIKEESQFAGLYCSLLYGRYETSFRRKGDAFTSGWTTQADEGDFTFEGNGEQFLGSS